MRRQHDVGTEVCAAEFKASDAALNSLGSESGQRQQHTPQNLGPIDSMEKGRTSGAAHKSSKGKSNSKGERASLSPEQYLVIKRQEAVEKVMAAFTKKLADELAIITHAHESSGGASGGSSYSGSGGGPDSGGGNAGRSSGRGKRQFDDGDRNESSSTDGNGGNGQDKGGNKRAKTEENPGPSFVCPFFRHNPKRFCHHRTCVGPGWKTIHRLKEHLYRVHKLPPNACPRCGDPFGDAKALNAHLRSDDPCRKKDIAAAQGIDEQQEKKLRERKRVGSAVTDEQRWRDIYMILFPEANKNNLPSSYYDVTDAEEYAKTTEHFMKYKKRIEKELPALIRKKVEQKFAHVGQELFANFDDFVRDGIHDIFSCPTPKSAPGSPRSCRQSPAPEMPLPKNAAEDLGFEFSSEALDLSAYFNDPDAPSLLIGGLDTNLDFGSNLAGCPFFDAESDSGYASTATISQYFDSSRR
ncbi:hypothetical protein PG994_001539 [Apiospora phragmitis]|uniref:C2H2-type domain-containing protein n=1 Tax=Apiospora phragmitis TaxID=2905665 RepID=A0ABR1WTS3_9PEZI